jgi:hypothetical protein
MDVIEIPLIAQDQDLTISFVNLLPIQTESIYNGFVFYNFPVDDKRKIFFYVLEPYDELENAHIWEHLIPKAPFSMIFFKWEEKVKGTPLEDMYTQYMERFNTPLLFLASNSNEELDLSSVDDEILQAHLENTLMYQPDNPESIRKTIIDALVLVRDSKNNQPIHK